MGLSKDEEDYKTRREEIADEALRIWLLKIYTDFREPPTIIPVGTYNKLIIGD
jgi:hypothetical protein